MNFFEDVYHRWSYESVCAFSAWFSNSSGCIRINRVGFHTSTSILLTLRNDQSTIDINLDEVIREFLLDSIRVEVCNLMSGITIGFFFNAKFGCPQPN